MMNKMRITVSCMVAFLIITMSYGQENASNLSEKEVRAYFVSSLIKIGDPLLTALSEDKLKERMPVERSPGAWDDRTHVTYLEGFGRLLSGMAPWLELGPDDTPEGKLREKYIQLALKSIDNATNPQAADFMNFTNDRQPLVDAAFFAQALLRSPNQLWGRLSQKTKANVIAALQSTRTIRPYYSNWLLFSGMVEAALLEFDGEADIVRMELVLTKHMEWYLGDGMYGDGPNFHWDYYNSFVIQPMMLDILKALDKTEFKRERDFEIVKKRASRYAEIQERLISPEGTYPPIGRSLAYRFGAFQLLSQVALWNELPKDITPAQVRSALYTVIKKQLEAPGTFDDNGWLQVGFFGHQPTIGEGYISTGSLYLCSEAFLVLGLEQDDPFWSNKHEDWTQKKIWSGLEIPIDKSE